LTVYYVYMFTHCRTANEKSCTS